jgi:hypothetical protein
MKPLAQALGVWLAKQSDDGLSHIVDSNAITQAFPDRSEKELSEALAELELDSYIATVTRGRSLPCARLSQELFAAFDLHAFKTNPAEDAIELARRALEGDDALAVAETHAATGWSLRRFNPALGILLSYIDERGVSQEINPTYLTTHFRLAATDRVKLRRLVDEYDD